MTGEGEGEGAGCGEGWVVHQAALDGWCMYMSIM